MHVQAFQDKYNELISFIKNANESCTVYLGKILPRGDLDVTEFNRSIQRVAENWAKNHVQYIDDTLTCSLGEMVYHGNIITLTMGFICRIQASRDY